MLKLQIIKLIRIRIKYMFMVLRLQSEEKDLVVSEAKEISRC